MHICLDVGLSPPFPNRIHFGKVIDLKSSSTRGTKYGFEILSLIDKLQVRTDPDLGFFTLGREFLKFANRLLMRGGVRHKLSVFRYQFEHTI